MRQGINLESKNNMWKGDNVGKNALHGWIKRRLEKPKRCEKCRKIKQLDLANRSGNYQRRLDDWDWLCRSCHMKNDGRLKNLKVGREKTGEYKKCLICGKELYRTKSAIKDGAGKYCSYKCTDKGRWRGLSKGKIGI